MQGFGYHHALNPDPYRGPYGDDGLRYAADVADLISAATPGRVAGFIAETIQGVGGAVPLATGYLPEVYKVRCRWGEWVVLVSSRFRFEDNRLPPECIVESAKLLEFLIEGIGIQNREQVKIDRRLNCS